MSDTGGGIHRGTETQIGGGKHPIDHGHKHGDKDPKSTSETTKSPAKPDDDGIHRG
jgi:hypothetical protein